MSQGCHGPVACAVGQLGDSTGITISSTPTSLRSVVDGNSAVAGCRCRQQHHRLLALHAGEAIGDSGQRRQAVEFVAQRFGRDRRVADVEPRPHQPALLDDLANTAVDGDAVGLQQRAQRCNEQDIEDVAVANASQLGQVFDDFLPRRCSA